MARGKEATSPPPPRCLTQVLVICMYSFGDFLWGQQVLFPSKIIFIYINELHETRLSRSVSYNRSVYFLGENIDKLILSWQDTSRAQGSGEQLVRHRNFVNQPSGPCADWSHLALLDCTPSTLSFILYWFIDFPYDQAQMFVSSVIFRPF
jgi:hypothetical protein